MLEYIHEFPGLWLLAWQMFVNFELLPVLSCLHQLGFIEDKSKDVLQLVKVLQGLSSKIKETVPLTSNSGKKLAQRIHGHMAITYGGVILFQVAHRWKNQINENSNAWAFYEIFLELNHNAVVCYQFSPSLGRKVVIIFLCSPSLPQRIQIRYDATCQLLDQFMIGYHIVDSEGDCPLSQMMSLVLFGDYISYYLAMLNGIDPSLVKAIDYLKEQLKKGLSESAGNESLQKYRTIKHEYSNFRSLSRPEIYGG